MIKIIARLGGFLGRASDGDPGSTVMWKGLRSMYEYIAPFPLQQKGLDEKNS